MSASGAIPPIPARRGHPPLVERGWPDDTHEAVDIRSNEHQPVFTNDHAGAIDEEQLVLDPAQPDWRAFGHEDFDG